MKFDSTILDFNDLVNAIESHEIENQIFLPITHITRWQKLANVLIDMELKTGKGNKHYEDEDLVFFSYGKNAFIPKSEITLQNIIFPPCLFVFEISSIASALKRILPFDSGGFDFYEIGKDIIPKNFEVKNPKIDDVRKLLYAFFKTIENYLNSQPDFGETLEASFCPFIKILAGLYHKQSHENSIIGKQCKTFEFQYSEPIPLKPILVIYPSSFSESPQKLQQIEAKFPHTKKLFYQSNGHPFVNNENLNQRLQDYILTLKK